MSNGSFNIPSPSNEPVLGYLPGSPERAELQSMMDKLARRKIDIPARINGRKVRTGKTAKEVQTLLLEEAGVATVAGTSFGTYGEGYVRFSYANSVENIRAALERSGELMAGLTA